MFAGKCLKNNKPLAIGSLFEAQVTMKRSWEQDDWWDDGYWRPWKYERHDWSWWDGDWDHQGYETEAAEEQEKTVQEQEGGEEVEAPAEEALEEPEKAAMVSEEDTREVPEEDLRDWFIVSCLVHGKKF